MLVFLYMVLEGIPLFVRELNLFGILTKGFSTFIRLAALPAFPGISSGSPPDLCHGRLERVRQRLPLRQRLRLGRQHSPAAPA